MRQGFDNGRYIELQAEHIRQRIGPVSYTPLDVYKRQSVTIDNVAIHSAEGKDLTRGTAPAAKVGDTLKFYASYDDYDEFDYEDEVELSDDEYAQRTDQWYSGEGTASAHAATGYSAIEGATKRELTVTQDMVGKRVLCYVTYGKWGTKDTDSLAKAIEGSSTTPATPDAKTLAEAKQKLSTWKPSPVYGTDTNICLLYTSHFLDIGHDESDHSGTYENGQARERTQVLMDVAKREGGLVVGTGDLSELALGWACLLYTSDLRFLRYPSRHRGPKGQGSAR